jgi:[protein-PII] uridylyltransferase
LAIEPLFASRSHPAPRTLKNLPPGQTQVEIDNHSSDRYTIIEVFADDRQGLLYVITKNLFELGLSVYSAKISTRLDQVADAFYVTTAGGEKLTDEGQLDDIREKLTRNIHAFETAG